MQRDIKACVIFTCCWTIYSKFWKYRNMAAINVHDAFSHTGQLSKRFPTTLCKSLCFEHFTPPIANHDSHSHRNYTPKRTNYCGRPTATWLSVNTCAGRAFCLPKKRHLYFGDITCIDIFAGSAVAWMETKRYRLTFVWFPRCQIRIYTVYKYIQYI